MGFWATITMAQCAFSLRWLWNMGTALAGKAWGDRGYGGPVAYGVTAFGFSLRDQPQRGRGRLQDRTRQRPAGSDEHFTALAQES